MFLLKCLWYFMFFFINFSTILVHRHMKKALKYDIKYGVSRFSILSCTMVKRRRKSEKIENVCRQWWKPLHFFFSLVETNLPTDIFWCVLSMLIKSSWNIQADNLTMDVLLVVWTRPLFCILSWTMGGKSDPPRNQINEQLLEQQSCYTLYFL